MIIREKPYPIIVINNYVYKFLPSEKLKLELNWLCLIPKINYFNTLCKSRKLFVPKITIGFNYIRMKNLGEPLYNRKDLIFELYDSISEFSHLNFKERFTTSLGDAQLRNIYNYKGKFAVLDLGSNAGKKVTLYYDRARFLVHLIDCNLSFEVNKILKNEKYSNEIIKEMDKRAIRVFKKRLFLSANFISAIYRLINYSKWRFYNKKLF